MSKLRIQIDKSDLICSLFNQFLSLTQSANGSEFLDLIKKSNLESLTLDLQISDKLDSQLIQLLEINQSNYQVFEFGTVIEKVEINTKSEADLEKLLNIQSLEKKSLIKLIEQTFSHKNQSSLNGKTQPLLERIPISNHKETILLPVKEIVTIVAQGEILQIRTLENQIYTINYRLKDLYPHLNQNMFIKLSRSAIGNIDMITRISHNPKESYIVEFNNGQKITVSRLQLKIFRKNLLRI